MRRGIVALAALVVLLLSTTSSAQRQYPYILEISNECYTSIRVAWRIYVPAGYWVTQGWVLVPSGQTHRSILKTYHDVFYLYAYSSDRVQEWTGKGMAGSIVQPIVSGNFTHTAGPLKGPGLREVEFALKRVEPGYDGVRQNYTC